MATSVRVAVTVLAGRQHGVISVSQAVKAGASRNLLSGWERTGAAVRVGHGIYRLAGWPDSWMARATAASLAVEAHAAVSHFAAARLLGMPLPRRRSERAGIEVTYFRRERLPRPPVRAHESNILERGDVGSINGVQVTLGVFTIGALASRMRDHSYFRFVDDSLADNHASLPDLTALATRMWSCPGVPMLREAIDRHHPAVRLTRSERERLLFLLLRDAGLPLPDVDVEVMDASGRRRYLDFAYLDLRLWLEFDSDRHHVGSIARRSDGLRQNDLVFLNGERWSPLRFDDRDLFDHPEKIVEAVREALRHLGATTV